MTLGAATSWPNLWPTSTGRDGPPVELQGTDLPGRDPDSRWTIDTIVERLRAPAYVSPQGVAMITLLLADGTGPLYGNQPVDSRILSGALEVALHAIDNGPALVG